MIATTILIFTCGFAVGSAAAFALLAIIDRHRDKARQRATNPYSGMAQGTYRPADTEPTELDQ